MTRLEYPLYLDHIRSQTVRFREVLADCDPAAPVPSCPKWNAADLLWHLGEVQHWWDWVIRNRPADPNEGYDQPARAAAYTDLLAFLDQGLERLTTALSEADPEEPAYSWSPNATDHNVGFTFRRQAQEALIHRLDAELTAGTVTGLDPALAADGVHECLDLMYGGLPEWGRFDPLPHYVQFRLTDVGQSVWVQLGTFSGTDPSGTERSGEDDLHVVPDPGVPADAVVSGAAGDVDAWLWHRGDDSGITVAGDLNVYGHVRAIIEQPVE